MEIFEIGRKILEVALHPPYFLGKCGGSPQIHRISFFHHISFYLFLFLGDSIYTTEIKSPNLEAVPRHAEFLIGPSPRRWHKLMAQVEEKRNTVC
jgi:hypothetical protein